MNAYIIKESQLSAYYDIALKDGACLDGCRIKAALLGLPEADLSSCGSVEEVKKSLEIGDCLLLEYDEKLLPFQVVHKRKNGNVVLSSYYVLDNHIFDEKTNVWRDSSIRSYMNNEMAGKFDPEFLKLVKTVDVHTDDYVTKDKLYLLSHEEIGFKDENGMFRENVGTEAFDYYKVEEKKEAKAG